MRSRSIRPLLAAPGLTLAMLAAGCSSEPTGYPSLAPRPVERLSLSEPAQPAVTPPVASAEATARYAPLVAKARAADAKFRAAIEAESATIAEGRTADRGSDAWTAAQVALTRVETARGSVAQILASLDAATQALVTSTDSSELAASRQAFEAVRAIDEQEAATVETLWPKSAGAGGPGRT